MPRYIFGLVGAALAALLAAKAQAAGFDLQQALRDATPGQTLRVPAGSYRGPFTIDKPLTLVADGKVVITGGGQGDVMTVKAENVTIRGFHIQGSGDSLDHENSGISVASAGVTIENNVFTDVLFGIYLRSAPRGTIRGNTISGKNLELGRRGDAMRIFGSSDCIVEDNRVTQVRDVVMWFSNHQTVRNNTVTESRYGLHFMYSDDDLVEGNHTEGNSVGSYMMYSHNLTLRKNHFLRNRGPSGYGIGLKEVDGIDATENVFAGNRVGIYIDNSPSRVDVSHVFHHNTFLVNDIGISLLPNVRRTTFTENNFIDNFEQVAILGSGTLQDDYFSLNGRGNYWSDYRGYDVDGKGIGAQSYRSESLFENLMDREPRLRMFMFSPAQQAVEMAAQAFPAFKPRSKFIDEHPLMEAVAMPGQIPGQSLTWWIAAPLAALLGAALIGRRRNSAPVPLAPAPSDVATADAVHSFDSSIVLQVRCLTKRFGSFTAVNDLSFDLEGGQALAIWGENGAGKTTAIKCILGLLKGKGEIEVCGHNQRRHSKAVRRCIGYVPQELNLYDDLSAQQVLKFFASLKRAPAGRINKVLCEVGLENHSHKRVRELSGGMKQRLALAVALLADPPLLVLDEMTSSLDAASRRTFVQLLNQQKRAGKTILFITHRLEEVEGLADQVLIMERGKLAGICPAADLPARLGLVVRMKVMLGEDSLDTAESALRAAGFNASRNGRGIYVNVSPLEKCRPIDELFRRGFAVRDFQIEEINKQADAHAGGGSHGNA